MRRHFAGFGIDRERRTVPTVALRVQKFHALVVMVAAFLIPVPGLMAQQVQAMVTKVTAAEIADTTLKPGDVLTIDFTLANGGSEADSVSFHFAAPGGGAPRQVYTLSPGEGRVSITITDGWVNGSYSLESIHVGDRYGRSVTYLPGNVLSGNYPGRLVPAEGPAPDFAAVRFSVSGANGDEWKTPEIAAVTRTSPARLTAGQPVTFSVQLKPGFSRVDYIYFMPSGARSTQFITIPWNGSDIVTIPTTTSWPNGSYRVMQISVGGDGHQNSYGYGDAPALVTDALDFEIVGGVEGSTFPTLTRLSVSGSKTVSAGETRTVSFEFTGGDLPVSRLTFVFEDASGREKRLAADMAAGRLEFTVEPDWLDGPFTLSSLGFGDSFLRGVYYDREGWFIPFPLAAQQEHALDFSLADFVVTGAVSAKPQFVRHPQSITILPGAMTALTVEAAGLVTTRFQWYVGEPGDTRLPVGYEGQQLVVQNLDSTTSYWVRASNEVGTSDSRGATVSVAYPAEFPVIIKQPESKSARVGNMLRAEITAVGPSPLSYQWFKNGVAVPGKTSNRIDFPNAQLGDSGSYFVVVTNPQGTVTSETIELTAIAVPQIVTQPVSQTVRYGETATFTVEATGGNLRYLWSREGPGYGSADGKDTPTLTIPTVDGGDAGNFYVDVWNSAGRTKSVSARLIVEGGPLSEISIGSVLYAAVGVDFGIDIQANNHPSLFAVTGLPDGLAFESEYSIRGVPTKAGTYKAIVSVTNAGGVATKQVTFVVHAGAVPPWINVRSGLGTRAGDRLALLVDTDYQVTSVRWTKNGSVLPTATGIWLELSDLQPLTSGLYAAEIFFPGGNVAANIAIVGVRSDLKVLGMGDELSADVLHPNGNIFDQVLLTGVAEAITADHAEGQITRTSFIDLDGDIVQVEFSGPGTLSLVLEVADDESEPARPEYYSQDVNYMKGHAGIVIVGATERTNVSVFTVGRATAFDPTGGFNILLPVSVENDPAKNGSPLFVGHEETDYDGIADIAFIAIASANGQFGGVRTSNAHYFAEKGLTGVYAPGVAFQGPVFIGDVTAFDEATPAIQLGSASDVRITGGDLLQDNGAAVEVSGITQLKFTAGSDSHGELLPAMMNRAVLIENDENVTAQIVVNP